MDSLSNDNTSKTAPHHAESLLLGKLDLTSAVEQMADGMVITDSKGTILYVNPAFTQMTGYGAEECVGQNPRLLKSLRQDPDYYRHLWDTITQRRVWKGELINRRKDGSLYAEEMTITPVLDEQGKMIGHIAVKHDVTQRRAIQAAVEESLREKEALLREIHHRVKNNLQIVCSLLKLNSRNITDPEARTMIEDMQHRVKAMALVHETLYRSNDLAGIDFSEYIPRLTEQLLHAHGLTSRYVTLVCDVESATLPIDVAIPCALMLTELISNAAKHVFTLERAGRLKLVFRRTGAAWLLEVRNNRRAAGGESGASRGVSFGLELVRLLTEQLDGTLEMEQTEDFCVRILFPLPARMVPEESR